MASQCLRLERCRTASGDDGQSGHRFRFVERAERSYVKAVDRYILEPDLWLRRLHENFGKADIDSICLGSWTDLALYTFPRISGQASFQDVQFQIGGDRWPQIFKPILKTSSSLDESIMISLCSQDIKENGLWFRQWLALWPSTWHKWGYPAVELMRKMVALLGLGSSLISWLWLKSEDTNRELWRC